MEHIRVEDVPDFTRNIGRLLKSGAYSVHTINLKDHLYTYDRTVSPKQYLRYPDWAWRLWFENDVQYINRIQRPDWLDLFKKAGLTLVEEEIETEDLSGISIDKTYNTYSDADLRCSYMGIVHRKPTDENVVKGLLLE